jgi:hypothetical protein
MAERRCDRALVARLDLEQRERKALSLLRERTRRGRKALALCKRTLECLQALARDTCLFAKRLALGTDASVENAPRPRQLGAETVERRLRALAPQLQPLARAAQPVERRGGLLASAGRVGELLLRAAPLFEQRVELLVGVLARQHRGGAAALAVLQPLAQLREVELGHARPQRGDLAAELLRPFGSRSPAARAVAAASSPRLRRRAHARPGSHTRRA